MIYTNTRLLGKPELSQNFVFELNVWSYLSWSSQLLDFHIFILMLLLSLLEGQFALSSATTFQTTFHWLSGLFPPQALTSYRNCHLSEFLIITFLIDTFEHLSTFHFLLDSIRTFWTKHLGNSVTVDC